MDTCTSTKIPWKQEQVSGGVCMFLFFIFNEKNRRNNRRNNAGSVG